MIHLNNIYKSYSLGTREINVLKGINLHIGKGEMVSIMGSSGSGKSTLLNGIGIIDYYDKGEYLLDGKTIENMNESDAAYYRNRYLGFIFQSFNLISFKSALENVALPLYYQKINKKKRHSIALDYLDYMGLKEWANHKPNQLSGGQKQRVAIARALITEPKVILADEPTGALDTTTSNEVMDILKEINKQGKTILIVTHEKDVAQKTNRTIFIKDGCICN